MKKPKLLQNCIFAYDSPDPNRRQRALEAARAFSLDPQLSVHELNISPGEANELWRRVKPFATSEDRLLMLVIDPRATVTRLGPTRSINPDFHYLG